MEADFEQHVVPSGAVCYYRDADHTYWRGIEPKKKRDPEGEWKGCGRLTGVSTASSPFDFNPDNLMRWAARTNGIGVAQLVNMILEAGEGVESFEWLRTAESIWTTLTEQGLTYADVRDARAEEGTNVHKHALYALATGKPVPDYHELTDAEQGYGSGVAAFWLEHFPEPLDAEGAFAVQVSLAPRQPSVFRVEGIQKDGGALAMRVYGHLRQEHSFAAIKKVSF